MEHELAWGLPVIAYFFLAGAGAGSSVISASIFLRSGGGHNHKHYRLARYAAFIGPALVMLGTTLIVAELGRIFRFMNLFKVVNLSPMNIGSWLLMSFIFLSLVYAACYLELQSKWMSNLVKQCQKIMIPLAWIIVPMGLAVAIYTGVMLGAMPARPLWNSPILAMLFMISALSSAVAAILLTMSLVQHGNISERTHRMHSAYLLSASDVMIIATELIVIFLLILFSQLTIGNVKYAMAILLPGGELAFMFWFWVVFIGLIIPGIIEMHYVKSTLFYEKPYKIPKTAEIFVCLAVLTGGFMLRYILVMAGQITGPIGL